MITALFSGQGATRFFPVALLMASNRDGGGSYGNVSMAGAAFVHWQGSSYRRLVLTFAAAPKKLKLDTINNGWTRPVSLTMGSTSIADIRGMTELDIVGNSVTATFGSDASSGWFRFNDVQGFGVV